MRKKYIVLSLMLILILFLSAWATPILRQEDNTFSVLSGIVRLSLTEAELVKYDEDDSVLYFISKSSLDEKQLESVFPHEGFDLTDQMGSGYIFTDVEESSRSVVVIGTQFTRFYRIWKIPKDLED